MKATKTDVNDALILKPQVFEDPRGFFMESYNKRTMHDIGIDDVFVQDNHSRSSQGVLRGLHYQIQHPQGKLVRVVRGAVWDVAVDLRKSSPSFGRWTGVELNEDNQLQFWVPPGFAHGFVVLSYTADFLYKATDFYAPQFERCIMWNDPTIGIDWPYKGELVLSPKDAIGCTLAQAEVFD